MGYCVGDAQLDHVFRNFKDVADIHKKVSDAQLHGLCSELSLSCQEVSP